MEKYRKKQTERQKKVCYDFMRFLDLESFRESPKACVTNSSRPPANLKGKGNPDLPLVCSNYWPPIVALFTQVLFGA
jgi:hypothetical protein